VAATRSAGILAFRRVTPPGGAGRAAASQADAPTVEVLVGHLGGPFWQRRDDAAWSIPKGEYPPAEAALAAAKREFAEELGVELPPVDLIDLGSTRQSGGKVVTVWAGDVDIDLSTVTLGTFELEWPKGSGRIRRFPELDRVAWLPVDQARVKLIVGQRVFLDRLTAAWGAGEHSR